MMATADCIWKVIFFSSMLKWKTARLNRSIQAQGILSNKPTHDDDEDDYDDDNDGDSGDAYEDDEAN